MMQGWACHHRAIVEISECTIHISILMGRPAPLTHRERERLRIHNQHSIQQTAVLSRSFHNLHTMHHNSKHLFSDKVDVIVPDNAHHTVNFLLGYLLALLWFHLRLFSGSRVLFTFTFFGKNALEHHQVTFLTL